MLTPFQSWMKRTFGQISPQLYNILVLKEMDHWISKLHFYETKCPVLWTTTAKWWFKRFLHRSSHTVSTCCQTWVKLDLVNNSCQLEKPSYKLPHIATHLFVVNVFSSSHIVQFEYLIKLFGPGLYAATSISHIVTGLQHTVYWKSYILYMHKNHLYRWKWKEFKMIMIGWGIWTQIYWQVCNELKTLLYFYTLLYITCIVMYVSGCNI